MVKLISKSGSRARQLIVIAAMTGLLVGCGGGAGDTVEESDFDGDLIVDSLDEDADGDGVLDIDDPFVDLDSDGFDDFSGLSEADATDTAEVIEGDTDGDGFVDVSETAVCGSERGSDNNSGNNSWDDNCHVKRATENGQFARSLYAVGIQRVLYCAGFGVGSATSYIAFADGIYGPNTETAVENFQRAEGITVDGDVGSETWPRLQERLTRLDFGIVGTTPDSYGFTDGPCAETVLFYQNTIPNGIASPIPTSWELARNAPNEDQRIPFSVAAPTGL